MNISEPNVTGLLWAVAGCLLLYIGLIVWEAGGYMKKIGAPEKDADIKRLREQLAGLSAAKEELVVKSAEIQRLSAQLIDVQSRQDASEKRLAQSKETENARLGMESELLAAKRAAENARAELDMLKAKAAGGAEQLAGKDAEIKRLKEQLAGSSAAKEGLAEKDVEIQRLNAQLTDMQSRQVASEKRLAQLNEAENARSSAESELLAAKRAAENARAELDMLKVGVSDGTGKLTEKDAEIKRLKEQLAGMAAERDLSEQNLAGFKKIESDAQWLENEIGECKRSSHDMKRRIEESRMKMRLLSEKSKENVELLASFADGKEFDEFRKSIHLDELIQKYEDEIKELRIKNMDLEKRVG